MVSIANSAAITALDAVADSCDAGSTNPLALLKIYDGVAPARVSAALSGNTLLSTHDCADPVFGAAVDVPGSNLARVTAGAIVDAVAVATAEAVNGATFARIEDKDGVVKQQFTVSESGGGGELIINSADIQLGATVQVTSLQVDFLEG